MQIISPFVLSIVTITSCLSLTQAACARPNYQDTKPSMLEVTQQPTPQANPGTNPNLSRVNCPLFFTTENLCATYAWVKQPTEDATGSFTLKFASPDGQPADPKMNLKVIIWMPDMGHGSSPVTFTKQAIGDYLVDRVFFSMHGQWQIRIQMKNAAAVAEEQIATVNF